MKNIVSNDAAASRQADAGREHVAWGKFRHCETTGESTFHPLLDHMQDVAACFLALVRIPAFERCLEKAAQRRLTAVDWQRLAVLVFLHDVGKANAGFQAKRWHAARQAAPAGWPAPSGHGSEALALLSDFALEQARAGLPLEVMQSWGEACYGLLLASISHHGKPVVANSGSSPIHTKLIWSCIKEANTVVYDPAHTVRRMGDAVQQCFPLAFAPSAQPELPQAPAFAHLFAGLVQLADWLGSDTRFFPYTAPGENRMHTAHAKAQAAVQAIGLDMQSWRTALPAVLHFETVFQVGAARPVQTAMARPGLSQLVVLESETGSGKTEAALWRYAQLLQTSQVDGLYFALPTRVAATQLYERVRKFAQQLWSASTQGAPAVVRALAGYENADGHALERLADFKVLWADAPDEQTAHLRWAAESSKRFLAAPMAVGTIDQALLGALQVRHAHLRHSLLLRSLLVVDEVHASDAYMSALLEHLLQAHLANGGHALLLSATLGASARHRYQRILQSATARTPAMPTLAQACVLPYPAMTDGWQLRALEGSPRSKTVHWQLEDCINQPERIAALAVQAARTGAKILVVRNTVPAAVATLRAVEALALEQGLTESIFHLHGVQTVHHSRYSRQDRPALDQAVEQQIGKERPAPLKACIVIGTQTLEQSLDLDADLLITDLCPMDVLLQRVGRLHRHERKPHERPERYRQAQAIVLTPPGHALDACLGRSIHGLGPFHQGGGIYPDVRILEATRQLLSATPQHTIPQDNRTLVEQATHPEALERIAQTHGVAWVQHGQKIDGEFAAQRTQAKLNMLAYGQPFDEDFHFLDQDQKVTTRLGSNDHLLTFEPLQPGPFGQPVHQIPLRAHLWPKGLAFDTPPADIEPLPQGAFSFCLGPTRFLYSRVGLERLAQT